MSKRKGKNGELEAAKRLGELLGVPIARSQQYKGSAHSADLDGAIGLHLEVKGAERFRLFQSLEKAESEAGENCPVVLHRRNGKRWVAVMYLADLVDVTEAVNRNRQRGQTCP